MISYLVRYNWAWTSGAIKPLDKFKGMAYDDMVVISLDEINEIALTMCKTLNMSYEDVLDMYYSDLTVLYAKYANEQAFSRYNEYMNLAEESKGKYVTDYGVPEPYVYSVLDAEAQRKNIEEKGSKLRQMYRHGGRFND